MINRYVYTIMHERLNVMGKIVSRKLIEVGDEIAYGSNRLKVVAGNRTEVVVIKLDDINIVELHDMKMNKIEFN